MRIAKLKWKFNSQKSYYKAKALFGFYYIYKTNDGGYFFNFRDDFGHPPIDESSNYNDIEKCKRAAQKHFEKNISIVSYGFLNPKIKWKQIKPNHYTFEIPFIQPTKYYIFENDKNKFVFGLGKALGKETALDFAKNRVRLHLQRQLKFFEVKSESKNYKM